MQAASQDDAPAGRYRLLHEIGRGRRAVVFLAEDSLLGRRVAVKRPHTAAEIPLLLDEARRLARIASPYVVSLHDVATQPTVCLVLELLDGESLRARLAARGRFEAASAAPLVRDLLRGLQALDAAGIVHGDIKPENLWITSDGRLVLLDLGAPGDTTALYAAPEVGLGDAATPAADLYAAAVVAYEMICGRPPFDAAAADELAARKRTQAAPPARQQGASVTPAIEAWLACALETRPERRHASPAAALQAWNEAAGFGVTALETESASAPILHPEAWSTALGLAAAVTRGQGGVIAIAADRGLGKSTLARRWCETVRARGGIALSVGWRSTARRTPYSAWRHAVQDGLPQLRGQGLGWMPRRITSAAGEAAQQERIVRNIRRQAGSTPIAIAVDELEACDGATRRLLLRLAQDATRLRIAVLLTTDDTTAGRVAASTREALAALGTVHRLSGPEGDLWRRCIAARLGVAGVSDALLSHLQQRTGNNPWLAHLVLAELRTAGALRRAGEGWVFRPELAGSGLPRGAAERFERRLHGLDAAALRLLQIAAVQGAKFDAALVAKRLQRQVVEVHDALQMLASRQALLRRDGERWVFEPPLLALHVVANLTPERRRREHEALATALVEAGSEDAAAIGAHLYHAGLEARALPVLEQAARSALERHDAESALASLDLACPAADRTLASEADAVRRVELGLLRTRALQALAAWDAAAAELENLLVLSRAWGQDAAEMRALRAQGEVEYGRSRFDAAITCWHEAQTVAARNGDEHELHELALKVGNIHFERGELEQAAAEYERALVYATTSGDLELEARAANNVALVESIQGRKQRAVQFFNRSLERFRALGRNDAVARLDQNIGQIYLELGNWAEARNFFQRAMDESEASGQQSLLAVACLDCAEANFRLGARAEAATAVERALAISRECGDEIGIANAYRLQASLAAAAGDTAAAEARLLESIERLQRLGQALQLGLCWKELGAVRLQAGRPGPAAAALAAARQVFASLDAPQHAAEVEALQTRCGTVPACPP